MLRAYIQAAGIFTSAQLKRIEVSATEVVHSNMSEEEAKKSASLYYILAMTCKGSIINSVMLARASRLARTELVDLYVRTRQFATRRSPCAALVRPRGGAVGPRSSHVRELTSCFHCIRVPSDSAFSTWHRQQAT